MRHKHRIAAGFVACCVTVFIVIEQISTHAHLRSVRCAPTLVPAVTPRPFKCIDKWTNTMCIKLNVTLPNLYLDAREDYVPIEQLDSDERIVYNRIPKCASSTVLEVLQKATHRNKVSFLHSVAFHQQDFDLRAERELVNSIQSQRTPWMYDRHMRMVNFTKFGFPMPRYINVYREPAERKRSHYYFGFDLYKLQNMSYDECVARRFDNCTYSFHMLRYFCGHEENCTFTDRNTLEIAKRNVVRYYDVVGIAEDLDGFFQLLEFKFPRVFKGAFELYKDTRPMNADTERSSHDMLESTREVLKEFLWPEYEFYEFVKKRFYDAKSEAGL